MPINVTASDPASAGYKVLIAALRANAFFMEEAGRFVDWSDGTITKPLESLLPADLAEITLCMGAFVPKPHGTNSRVAEMFQTYTLVAVTDTLQIAKVNALNYGVLAALNRADPESCQWGGQPFIENYQIANGSAGTGGVSLPGLSGSAARGVDRLASICSITLSLYVPRSSLPL